MRPQIFFSQGTSGRGFTGNHQPCRIRGQAATFRARTLKTPMVERLADAGGGSICAKAPRGGNGDRATRARTDHAGSADGGDGDLELNPRQTLCSGPRPNRPFTRRPFLHVLEGGNKFSPCVGI